MLVGLFVDTRRKRRSGFELVGGDFRLTVKRETFWLGWVLSFLRRVSASSTYILSSQYAFSDEWHLDGLLSDPFQLPVGVARIWARDKKVSRVVKKCDLCSLFAEKGAN